MGASVGTWVGASVGTWVGTSVGTWVELYDGAGFVGFDPTQLRPTDDGYLRINVGRDSRDCAINRGMFTGTAQQSMEVCARMTEI